MPLTAQDITALEEVLVKSGIGADAHVAQARATKDGLGVFIRSLVGLEREAVMAALGEFVNDKPLSADQIEFVTMVVDHLTERGLMDPAALYESPFVDISPHGPEGMFPDAKVIQLVSALEDIRRRAAA